MILLISTILSKTWSDTPESVVRDYNSPDFSREKLTTLRSAKFADGDDSVTDLLAKSKQVIIIIIIDIVYTVFISIIIIT